MSIYRVIGIFGVVSLLFFGYGCGPKKQVVKEEAPVEVTPPEETPPPVEEVKPELALNRINFDFDKYDIRSGDAEILQQDAEILKAYSDVKVLIEGHTCEIGTAEYNMALGERRAKAAMEYLVNLGIASDRLSTVSYGEERPLDPNNLPINRRAEFAPQR